MSSLCFWHVGHPEFLPLSLEHQIYFGRNQIVSEISFSNQFLETIPNGGYPVSWLLEQHFSNRTFLENLPFSSMIYMIYRWWVSSSVSKKQAYKPSGLSPRTDSNYELPYNAQVKRRLDRMIPSTNSKVSNVSNDDSNVSRVRNHVANHIGYSRMIDRETCSLFRQDLGDGDMFGYQGIFMYFCNDPYPKIWYYKLILYIYVYVYISRYMHRRYGGSSICFSSQELSVSDSTCHSARELGESLAGKIQRQIMGWTDRFNGNDFLLGNLWKIYGKYGDLWMFTLWHSGNVTWLLKMTLIEIDGLPIKNGDFLTEMLLGTMSFAVNLVAVSEKKGHLWHPKQKIQRFST